MPLGERNLPLHHALELTAVGEPGQMVGARLACELTRSIDGDRDLVGDRSHEQKVGGAEDAVAHCADRHHADCAATDPQVSAQRVPLRAGHAVDLRLRPAVNRRGRGLDVRPDLARELIDLVLVQADRVRNLIGRALAQPHRAGAQPQRRERLHKRDLRGFHQVE